MLMHFLPDLELHQKVPERWYSNSSPGSASSAYPTDPAWELNPLDFSSFQTTKQQRVSSVRSWIFFKSSRVSTNNTLFGSTNSDTQ